MTVELPFLVAGGRYGVDNAVVIVAGKFDEAAAVRLLEQTFGPMPKPTRTLTQTPRPSDCSRRRSCDRSFVRIGR